MIHQPPWHQRSRLIRASRGWARQKFFEIARAAAGTNEGRAILTDTLGDLLAWRPGVSPTLLGPPVPYDLGRSTAPEASPRERPIFITARFRSGSTLLWNLFRHVNACTAYYEPFNERRWFDEAVRGTRVDPTHHVDDYWKEYEGLSELAGFYHEDWIRRFLYMDQTSWNPDMANYVRSLVAHARGRAVLQFNRIDFRLPWFRTTFPEAVLVHLFRHPRDQWCSSFPEATPAQVTCSLDDFVKNDHYYLLMWADDLKDRFPFLAPSVAVHPYRIFYYVWRLSLAFGQAYADYSLSFDDLTERPQRELRRLLDAVGLHRVDAGPLCSLVRPAPPRWSKFADDSWFRSHETACETVLREFHQLSAEPVQARRSTLFPSDGPGLLQPVTGNGSLDVRLEPTWSPLDDPRTAGHSAGLP